MAQQFSDNNFSFEVIEASKEKPVLVDFFADWCGPCKVLAPVIDELAEAVSGKAIVGKVNIDEAQKIASEYNVMSIPTIIIFKDGQAQETLVGLRDKASLEEALEKYL